MSFLFAHRRGYGVVPAAGRGTFPPSADGESPAEVQQKTPRPSGANPPAAVRVPRSADAVKGAARQGRTRLRQFVCPGQPVQKRSRPSGANTLTQFAHPGQPVLKKLPPHSSEHACAVRVSRLTLRSYLTILREQSMLFQQQNRRKYEPVHPCTLRSVPRH